MKNVLTGLLTGIALVGLAACGDGGGGGDTTQGIEENGGATQAPAPEDTGEAPVQEDTGTMDEGGTDMGTTGGGATGGQ